VKPWKLGLGLEPQHTKEHKTHMGTKMEFFCCKKEESLGQTFTIENKENIRT